MMLPPGRLGAHAFYTVFMRKRTVYARTGVLQELKAELELPRYRAAKRHLSRIARESFEAMLANFRF